MTAATTLDELGHAPLNGDMADTIEILTQTIAARRTADPATSYVAKLHAGGMPLIARKFGEEAVETVVAALSLTDADVISEAADALFHLLVLLGARGLSFADVTAELERREGVSGVVEKAARPA
jgi:phosphoribosyl-ATP pyrophosphohydrolase